MRNVYVRSLRLRAKLTTADTQRERETERETESQRDDKAQGIVPHLFLNGAVWKNQDHSLQSSF